MGKPQKDRSDVQVGNIEKKHKLEPGTLRNTDQTYARSDRELSILHH